MVLDSLFSHKYISEAHLRGLDRYKVTKQKIF
jgi:hypothetical protein